MLYVLIPLAMGLLGLAVWALLWAIKTGQFDDLESHGWSVVLDDDQKPPPLQKDLPTDDVARVEDSAADGAGKTLAEPDKGQHKS
jgi:cbb3-type cytochrome oxidase maturation protein